MFTFHPGNHIVQRPRRYQGHDGGGEKPTPGWRFEKCKEAIGDGQGKLGSKAQTSDFRNAINFNRHGPCHRVPQVE
jgi:hypothetical protein